MKIKSKRGKPALPASRKEKRKEARKLKKKRRNDYYTNRNKPGKFVLLPPNAGDKAETLKPKVQAKSQKHVAPTVDENTKRIAAEKRQTNKLQKQMQKRRRKQMEQANVEEDRNIKRLEKQLKLNKRKSSSIPKSFVSEGLDYLLEVCDSENLKGAVIAEQQISEVNDEFEEDFALMTGKTDRDGDDSDDGQSDDELDSTDEENDGLEAFDDLGESSDDDDVVKTDLKGNDKKRKVVENDDVQKKRKIEDDYSESNDDSDGNNNFDEDSGSGGDNAESNGNWEDIYGRTRTKDGSIVTKVEAKYIPPSIRAQMEGEFSEDKKQIEKRTRLRRQLKGLLNRLAEANMHSISTQLEELYMNNSRNDMNDTITKLMMESLVSNVLSPERLLLEHVMLITILHANIGTEVGAHFLQTMVIKFDELYQSNEDVENKKFDNIVNIIAQLYNFKVFHSQLLYQILSKLAGKFDEKCVECILLVLKNVGFSLRKDDPLALKALILDLQRHAANVSEELKDNSRVKYMLDVLLAIKNNNMSKIPNYDTSYSEHLKKLLKGFIRKGNYVTQLNISLDDLLKADERGKWWVVGSAWTGNVETDKQESKPQSASYSQKLLELAKKQRMNTDARRNIFCIIMSAEDYLDAFEKLLHLGLKNQQEREIIHVILHCCLQEKSFNPYYAILAQKFCEYDRKYQMTIKYSIWDKLKSLTDCSSSQLSNLAKLLTHLFVEKGLPISTLKIVQFSELDKITLRFVRQILLGILLHEDAETCVGVFEKVGQSDKLKMFRESLRLFIHHFMLRNLSTDKIPDEQKQQLKARADVVEKMLSVNDRKMKF